VEPFVYVSPA
jgi:hypothetical protein